MATVKAYETAAGKRYRVRYRKPDHSQTDKRGFKTKREAEIFMASIEVSKAIGEYIDPTAGRVTVGSLAEAWLPNQSHLKPSAYRPVEIAWRVHVKDKWGTTPIGNVKHDDVQTWVTEMGKASGATTVLRAYGVLASILDGAVKNRRIPSNPARGINLPRKTKKAHAYLTFQQVETLAAEAKDHTTLVYLLAYTGLRWGEATGLRVRSRDTGKRRLSVDENAVKVGEEIIVGTPKTHEARTVPYPAFLDDALDELVKGKKHAALIFGDGINHQRLPHSTRGWFVLAVKRCQAKDETFPTVTPHDLRHTAASLAVSAGANVKAVQRMLGHASAAMTLDTYADLFDDDLDAVGVSLDSARALAIVGK